MRAPSPITSPRPLPPKMILFSSYNKGSLTPALVSTDPADGGSIANLENAALFSGHVIKTLR